MRLWNQWVRRDLIREVFKASTEKMATDMEEVRERRAVISKKMMAIEARIVALQAKVEQLKVEEGIV